MSINSFLFLLAFLPAVAVVVHVLRARRGPGAAQGALLVASLAFYAGEGVAHLVLLLAAVTFNWAVARRLERPGTPQPARKRTLVLGLVANVALLCLFKYWQEFRTLVAPDWPPLAFPLGVSFFTLTQVMYLVDCYEGLVPARRWFDHATFVTFFPNVTAGPILRAKLFFGRLGGLGAAEARDERLARAAGLIALGLVKKAVLGDSFAEITTAGYAHLAQLSTPEAWALLLAGAFEIYFDFSGYSDMAYGCAELLGLPLARNFDAPFRAANISEFWKRWHMTLSDFITTYLYTPMLRAMGKATLHKSALATLAAMVIAGVWHGATWNFVLFGVLHGVALAGYQYWKRRKRPLPRPAAVAVTFLFVSVTFITVLAPDLHAVGALLARLLPTGAGAGFGTLAAAVPASEWRMILVPIAVGAVVAFAGPKAEELAARFRPSLRWDLAVVALLLVAYAFMSARDISDFRYRQF
ncbi:MAG: hypothetical protein K1X31_14560 [Gemmatimonadaceae bacterium]|nr:hypothetical protein [Gemmatimonadaceae bacterium]